MSLLLPFSFLAFIALGLPDGILGIAWPGLQAEFGLPLDRFGILIAFLLTGYILSSFACGKLLALIGIGPLLASSTLLAAASLAGFAVLPSFGLLLVAAFLGGLGGGAVDSALNTYAALRFSPRAMNWLHASYSLGAMLGPLSFSLILKAHLSWRWGFGMVAVLQTALGIFFLATLRSWNAAHLGAVATGTREEPAASRAEPAAYASSYRGTLARSGFWPGVLAFFAYVGLEFSVSQWSFTLLTQSRGLGAENAALWISLFWGGFFGGRVVAGLLPISGRVAQVLGICAAGMIAGALLVATGGIGPATLGGLLLLGLSFAPVFPMLIATTPGRLGTGHSGNAMGFQVSSGTLGQAVIPGLIGIAAQRLGIEAIAYAFVLSALSVAACLAWLIRGGLDRADPIQRKSL